MILFLLKVLLHGHSANTPLRLLIKSNRIVAVTRYPTPPSMLFADDILSWKTTSLRLPSLVRQAWSLSGDTGMPLCSGSFPHWFSWRQEEHLTYSSTTSGVYFSARYVSKGQSHWPRTATAGRGSRSFHTATYIMLRHVWKIRYTTS